MQQFSTKKHYAENVYSNYLEFSDSWKYVQNLHILFLWNFNSVVAESNPDKKDQMIALITNFFEFDTTQKISYIQKIKFFGLHTSVRMKDPQISPDSYVQGEDDLNTQSATYRHRHDI